MDLRRRQRTDVTDVALGARIRARRADLNVSQAALAEVAGVSYQQIQKYERGADRVTVPVLLLIAARLECSAGALLGEERPENENSLARQLSLPGALELVANFSRIRSDDTRRTLLGFLREVAEATSDDDEPGAEMT